MIYIELYLYDYLKKKAKKTVKTELWGEYSGGDFYICHLRTEGEGKPFYKAHMQYLGDYQGLENTDEAQMLLYQRSGKICRQESAVYVAKETRQIEHFLIREDSKGKRAEEVAAEVGAKSENRGKTEGIFIRTAVCAMMVFLAANMVEALSSYKSMQEIIEVMELLVK